MISFGFWIAKKFLGKAISERQAKRLGFWVALPILLVLLALLAWGGKRLYDRGVVEQHVTKREAEIATGVLKADRAADVAMENRAVAAEAENVRLENVMAEAERKDPEKAKTEVGPVQQSYFDNLPKQRR